MALGSQKTLTKLKVEVNTQVMENNLGIEVRKIVKGNATKPQIMRELFKVTVVRSCYNKANISLGICQEL